MRYIPMFIHRIAANSCIFNSGIYVINKRLSVSRKRPKVNRNMAISITNWLLLIMNVSRSGWFPKYTGSKKVKASFSHAVSLKVR